MPWLISAQEKQLRNVLRAQGFAFVRKLSDESRYRWWVVRPRWGGIETQLNDEGKQAWRLLEILGDCNVHQVTITCVVKDLDARKSLYTEMELPIYEEVAS